MAKAFKASAAERPTLTAVINTSVLVVLSCRWAGPQPRLDTGGRGWAIACLTTLYDIAIHWLTISIQALVMSVCCRCVSATLCPQYSPLAAELSTHVSPLSAHGIGPIIGVSLCLCLSLSVCLYISSHCITLLTFLYG